MRWAFVLVAVDESDADEGFAGLVGGLFRGEATVEQIKIFG